MAHPEQRQFVESVKLKYPHFFRNKKVLEVGSRYINGTIRDLFEDCGYIGLDCCAGEGVDQVCLAHEVDLPPNSFDVVCSCEAFEHDPYFEKTVIRMFQLLKPGGLFFSTCAGENRTEHGTTRTATISGEQFGPDPNFYEGISIERMLSLLRIVGSIYDLQLLERDYSQDLYCSAIKGQ